MKRYEAMFLFDNTTTQQWSEMEGEVRRLCDRIQADLHVCVKFDERKLAFEIKGRKRGTYLLTYFDADPNRIGELERDAQLSDLILRALVLRADKISAERLAELKAWPAEQPLQPLASDSRRGEPVRTRRDSAAQDEGFAGRPGPRDRRFRGAPREADSAPQAPVDTTPGDAAEVPSETARGGRAAPAPEESRTWEATADEPPGE